MKPFLTIDDAPTRSAIRPLCIRSQYTLRVYTKAKGVEHFGSSRISRVLAWLGEVGPFQREAVISSEMPRDRALSKSPAVQALKPSPMRISV